MEAIHSILVSKDGKSVWYKVWDKVLVNGNTMYLCQSKEDEACETVLINPQDVEVFNG